MERGLARSRTHAQELIDAGVVLVDGTVAAKASLTIEPRHLVALDDSRAARAATRYVSRAAFKLLGALDACAPGGLEVAGRDALDAGASTGGFTQVLLERGARHVIAIDVGHDQLAESVAGDPRVTAIEGVNVRDLTAQSPGAGVSLVVADLSFISLTYVIAPLMAFAAERADFLLMVKPQFEVGKAALGRDGVVRDARRRADAVAGVVVHMRECGLTIHNISRSALPGPAGNQEFFVWGSSAWQASAAGAAPALNDAETAQAISAAVEGP